MKILKYLLFAIVGIVVIVLVAALFIPKKYHVERSVLIHAPQPLIMDQVKNFKNANQWSPFVEMDPNMEITYSGAEGEVGSSSSWNSPKKAGVGSQTITKLTNDRMETRLDFKKPMESTAMASFQTQNEGDNVKITWAMDGQNPYPMNVMVLFMDKMLGKDFERGLNNLKARCEGMEKEGNITE